MTLPNITAKYLGLTLNSPVVIGACPLTRNPETVRELAIAGAGAIVLPSLFEEQVAHEIAQRGGRLQPDERKLEEMSYSDQSNHYNGGPTAYVRLVSELKHRTGIPVIASLNGCTGGRWLGVAHELEEAGADALEVSFECEQLDPALSATEVEEQLLACVNDLCDQVAIPVSIKLAPFHTSLANLAWRLTEAGASGIVCFAHEPVWQIETDSVHATLNWSLTPANNINPLIAGLVRVRSGGPNISVAASGGICSLDDLVKTILAGADVGMVTSELFRCGPDVVSHLVEGLSSYLSRKGLSAFTELVSSRPKMDRLVRESRIRSLTQGDVYVDPTPRLQLQSGDQWGHLH